MASPFYDLITSIVFLQFCMSVISSRTSVICKSLKSLCVKYFYSLGIHGNLVLCLQFSFIYWIRALISMSIMVDIMTYFYSLGIHENLVLCLSVFFMTLMVQRVIESIPHGRPIKLFLIPVSAPQLVYKGCGICYPLCEIGHIKEPLLVIGKSNSWCGGFGLPFSLFEWSFAICLIPYNHK